MKYYRPLVLARVLSSSVAWCINSCRIFTSICLTFPMNWLSFLDFGRIYITRVFKTLSSLISYLHKLDNKYLCWFQIGSCWLNSGFYSSQLDRTYNGTSMERHTNQTFTAWILLLIKHLNAGSSTCRTTRNVEFFKFFKNALKY